MKNKKYILGGGITGLIFAFYNREYTIISPDLGGRLNKGFFKNIIYLHHTKETERFLNDVGIKFNKRTQMIKYAKGSKVTTHIDAQDKVLMIQKKLDDKSFNPTDLNLSTADYYISILEFNYQELIEKISSHISHINDNIIRITDKEIVTELTSYPYDSAVSTLPANIFWRLYLTEEGKRPLTQAKPVTFVLGDMEPEFCKGHTYDMIYLIDDEQKYTRMSKKPGDRDNVNILYEFTGKHDVKDLIQYLPEGMNIIETYVDYQGIIYSNKNNIPPKNIIFVGRFSTWNHSDKQQDVVKQALFNYDIRHIFNRQAGFTKFHIDFNRLGDIEYKEQLTKDFILLLNSEINEVLGEINYKPHKKRKDVNVNAVRVELMDCFKFLLNLFIIWGMDAEDLIEVFNQKSDLVEQRLKDEFKK